MLKECTVSELPALMTENPNAVFYRVSRRPLEIKGMKSVATSLAQSKYLFTDYRAGRCDWEQYIARYKKQIKESRSAQRMLNSLVVTAKYKDIFFVCYCGLRISPYCDYITMIKIVVVYRFFFNSPDTDSAYIH